MEIYIDPKYASLIIDVAQNFGITAAVIGRVEAADSPETKEVLIKNEQGRFIYN